MPPRKSTNVNIVPEPNFESTLEDGQPEAPPAESMTAAQAFIRAQSEIGNVAKKSYNPGFKSKFVDLESAVNAIIPVLNRNGFGVMQGVHYIDGTPCLDTTLLYEDGSILGGYSYPLVSKDMQDPQKVGGSLTYARRYSLMAIVGSAPEDDDGNSAATPPPAPKKVETPRSRLGKMIRSAGVTDAKSFKEAAKVQGFDGVEAFADLTDEQITSWLANLENTPAGVPF